MATGGVAEALDPDPATTRTTSRAEVSADDDAAKPPKPLVTFIEDVWASEEAPAPANGLATAIDPDCDDVDDLDAANGRRTFSEPTEEDDDDEVAARLIVVMIVAVLVVRLDCDPAKVRVDLRDVASEEKDTAVPVRDRETSTFEDPVVRELAAVASETDIAREPEAVERLSLLDAKAREASMVAD